MGALSSNDFCGEHSFFLCFVCQHCSADDVTNPINSGHGGLQLIVDRESASLIGLQADLIKAQAICEGFATNSYEAVFTLKAYFVPLFILGSHHDLVVTGNSLLDSMAQVKLDAELTQNSLHFLTQ